jgi:hypothetical protein
VEQAIDAALETGCRVHGSQEGVTRKEILEFIKKVLINNVIGRIAYYALMVCGGSLCPPITHGVI